MGRLKRNSRLSFQVSPGNHELVARIDWCSSNAVTFSVAPGDNVEFDVASSLRGWRVAGAVFALSRPQSWLTLRLLGGAE